MLQQWSLLIWEKLYRTHTLKYKDGKKRQCLDQYNPECKTHTRSVQKVLNQRHQEKNVLWIFDNQSFLKCRPLQDWHTSLIGNISYSLFLKSFTSASNLFWCLLHPDYFVSSDSFTWYLQSHEDGVDIKRLLWHFFQK